MNKKKTRKGFTLVELLVVIAILAILATVSIVGYTSFTEKAKDSNDKSLIAQLNTALEANEAIDGKPKTMHEALEVVKETGYLVENLTPSSAKNEFLWNQEENKFVILSVDTVNSTTLANPSLWVIVNDEERLNDLQDTYSVYLGKNYIDADGIVNVANGFDAGEYQGVENINLTTNKAVTLTLRTNGGNLNINAASASVNHYAVVQTLDITAVYDKSYHEYGVVLGNVYLEQGRFVAENSSEVANVIVTSTTTNNVKVDNNSTNTFTVAATNENVASSIDSITSGQTNNQASVVDGETLKLFAGGIGSEQSPYLISNENELLNISTVANKKTSYYKLISNFTLTKVLKIKGNYSSYLNLDDYRIDFDTNGSIELSEEAILTLSGENSLLNMLESHNSGQMIYTYGNSTLNIQSGRYNSGLVVVLADESSTVNVYGGTFSTFAIYFGNYWILNLQDNTQAKIIVYGGTFINYNPAESHTENPVANFIADGFNSVIQNEKTDGTFECIVVPKEK